MREEGPACGGQVRIEILSEYENILSLGSIHGSDLVEQSGFRDLLGLEKVGIGSLASGLLDL